MFPASDKLFATKKDVIAGISATIGSLIVIGLTHLFAPGLIPWSFFAFWKTTGTLSVWLSAAMPIFIWAVVLSVLTEPFRFKDKTTNRFMQRLFRMKGLGLPTPGEVMTKGFLTSLWAGISEEIHFRWLATMAFMGTIALFNFLFFGFLGFGIPEWLNTVLVAPIANFFTAGHLEAVLINGPWLISAAVLGANAIFRDGHKYQGFLGYVNSWFLGMFLFWMMFKFGLPAAIIAHVIYDIIIYFWVAGSIAIRRLA